MLSPDQRTENYLKQFQPKAIGALPVGAAPQSFLPRRLTAVAALALCATGLFWFAWHASIRSDVAARIQPPIAEASRSPEPRTRIALTSLAVDDSEKFEALLREESRKSLPGFKGPDSTLRVLAGD